jgi:hypothetical protein
LHYRWGLGATTAAEREILLCNYAQLIFLAEKEVKLKRGKSAPSRVVTRAEALFPCGYRPLSLMDISPSDVFLFRRNLGFQISKIVVRFPQIFNKGYSYDAKYGRSKHGARKT